MGRPVATGQADPIDAVTVERFWARAACGEPSECWLWQGGRNLSGYGVTKLQGHFINASRAAWIIANGAIPEGMYVMHACDTRLCVNPGHLSVGTQRANVIDMDRKGRRARGYRVSRRGEAHQRAKLSDDQVAAIRVAIARGDRQQDVAAWFGVSRTWIGLIARGEKRA